jgi:hypothetical protein
MLTNFNKRILPRLVQALAIVRGFGSWRFKTHGYCQRELQSGN